MILSFRSSAERKMHTGPLNMPLDLYAAPENRLLRLVGYNGLGEDQAAYLQAYGLVPGRELRVLQHFPEVVVQVEHTELAFEREVANKIQVSLV